jgi:hypothetical protein
MKSAALFVLIAIAPGLTVDDHQVEEGLAHAKVKCESLF